MYYDNIDIQSRLFEFMGGDAPESATAVFITADDNDPDVQHRPRALCEFSQCLSDGLDVARSLWDHESIIAHIDIEYVNFDRPELAWIEPVHAFRVQRPVVDAVKQVLADCAIDALHLLSGRGHHFVWRVSRSSAAFGMLVEIGHLPHSLAERYRQPLPPCGESIDPTLGTAWNGLGLLMEYVGHSVLDLVADTTTIPITFTAVKVPSGGNGREAISFDLSEYGDPLHTRGIRMPFSHYLKPDQQQWRFDEGTRNRIPSLFPIPLHDMDVGEALRVMRNEQLVSELAARSSVKIPDSSQQTEELIADYRFSQLAGFHDWFYGKEHSPPEKWPETYDRISGDTLPPCVQLILNEPNERLLKPAGLQHVVRTLMARNRHPRHIAGLIRSRFERDYGWGDRWYRYSATARADFYARIFSGLIVTRRDMLSDYDCHAMRRKNDCPTDLCDGLLDGFRETLAIGTKSTHNVQAVVPQVPGGPVSC